MNQNIDGANHVKWSESQYIWSKSCQVEWKIYRDSVHMIDGAKPEIEGVNKNIDGAKCQVIEYFVV